VDVYSALVMMKSVKERKKRITEVDNSLEDGGQGAEAAATANQSWLAI
jgi:hypothetical protein